MVVGVVIVGGGGGSSSGGAAGGGVGVDARSGGGKME